MSKQQDGLQRTVEFYEAISPETLSSIDRVYAADAFFKDPFNEVTGLSQVKDVFRHMFGQVDLPRFVVTTQVLQGDDAFLTWDFFFYMKRFSREQQCIRGASHLRFDDEGRISYHRDYWDTAEELYEKIPLLRSFMRGLKRIAST